MRTDKQHIKMIMSALVPDEDLGSTDKEVATTLLLHYVKSPDYYFNIGKYEGYKASPDRVMSLLRSNKNLYPKLVTAIRLARVDNIL